MIKFQNIKSKVFLSIAVVIISGIILALLTLTNAHFGQPKITTHLLPTVIQSEDSFSYSGKTGSNALTLLKAKAKVVQDKSGLVIAINSRQADAGKHEYWAFYVNGKLADVGPADYQTKNTDVILWKIERY